MNNFTNSPVPYTPQLNVSYNGDLVCLRIRLQTRHDDPDHMPNGDDFLYRYLSINLVDGSTEPMFDYVGPCDM